MLVLAGWLCLALLLYFFQHRFIYFPDPALSASPADIGLEYQDLSLQTADGLALHAWYIPAKNKGPVILFFHGNAGNISHRLDSIQLFHALGLNVLIVDYRGYGRSQGVPSETGSYRDALAAWDYLIQQAGYSASEIIIFGRSLGGGVATWLASRQRPAALIVESSFTSVVDIAGSIYPYLPVKWLCRIYYPNIEHIPDVKAPVLVIHSEDDEIIPYHHGQRLYQAARQPKSFIGLRGQHNDAFLLSRGRYIEGIEGFLARQGIYQSIP